ncbi:hypothetical protein GMRT_10251 [Giardia muris]|uniref:Uncharacterized protein n=1 Tax=Giardia muris TaxID=5742 RepID=A0A4Z1SUA5_GIAMU|nr:hypothetical protein GMRT_10251 [Giardia muris]|eukprot:TNJ29456.1 hypothetical protein GMRT_10251 [Giardia muris]
MSRPADDPFFNVPEVVADEILSLRATVSALEVRCGSFEEACSDIRISLDRLRTQLLQATQLLGNYPTRREFEALRTTLTAHGTELPNIGPIVEAVIRAMGQSPPIIEEEVIRTMVAERVLLELEPLKAEIREIHNELEQKATKRSVTATLKARFDEVATLVSELQANLTTVLAEKADIDVIDNVLRTKVDIDKLDVLLKDFVVGKRFDKLLRSHEQLASNTNDLDAHIRELAREREMELATLKEELRAEFSQAQTTQLFVQQDVSSQIRVAVQTASEDLGARINDLEVLVRANSATLSKVSALADAASDDARRTREASLSAPRAKALQDRVGDLERRLNSLESDLLRKANAAELSSLQRYVRATSREPAPDRAEAVARIIEAAKNARRNG